MMIDRHDFNSQWWGEDAGIVRDAAFFELPQDEQAAALARYAWVEFRTDSTDRTLVHALNRAGFFFADDQIRFRIGLKDAASRVGTDCIDVRFADQDSLELEAGSMRPFEHERFSWLPGANDERISERYLLWSNELAQQHPERCLAVLDDGKVQGWFLSQPTPKGLNLTLAMLHRNSHISGLLLYARAVRAYLERGDRIGWASFSASNAAVLNIYARLGARFLAPEMFYLWVRGS